MLGKRLGRDFFERPTVVVAQELLGKIFAYKEFSGIICETEAYVGQDDPACHATKGLTPRTEVMFGPAGYTYVYLIYGMYHCLNFVTEKEGFPAAVLIRGLYLKNPFIKNLDGPGKLCRELNMSKMDNNKDLVNDLQLAVYDAGITPLSYETTPRIGIKVGLDKDWRFVCEPTKFI